MNRFAQMQAFVNVVDLHSFSAASEKLGVAKSLLSRRVSDLEKRLGVQLMQRTTRKLSLTDSGRQFYQKSVALLADLYEAEQLVSDQQCSLSGSIHLAAPLSFGLSHLARPLAEFQQQHEKIDIDLDLNDREVDLVEEGFDMAIRIGQLADSSLIARKLATIRFMTCASQEYLQRCGQPLHPQDLAQHKLMVYSNVASSRSWQFVESGKPVPLKINSQLRVNNGDFLAQMAVLGLGITRAPTFILSSFVESKKLVPILQDFDNLEFGMYALYPPGRLISRRVKILSDFLALQYGDLPYWDKH